MRPVQAKTLRPAPAPNPSPPDAPTAPQTQSAACAFRLAGSLCGSGASWLYLALDEVRAEDLAQDLTVIAPELEVIVLPGWDCLPYDRASPSRGVMGKRMRALLALSEGPAAPRLLIATPEALVQKLPPAPSRDLAEMTLVKGGQLDRQAFLAFAERCGYLACERVDEPGDAALFGEVLDVYPAAGAHPYRLRLDAEDKILEIDAYDPVTQRSRSAVRSVTLGPASEFLTAGEEPRPAGEAPPQEPSSALQTLLEAGRFDEILLEAEVKARAEALLEQVEDAYAAAGSLGAPETSLPPPGAIYLTSSELAAALARARPVEPLLKGVRAGRAFMQAKDPGKALIAHLKAEGSKGRRLVLSGRAHEIGGLKRAYQRGFGAPPEAAARWADALAAPAGSAVALTADLEAGFTDPQAGLTLVAAADVFGGRIVRRRDHRADLLSGPELQIGDVVIHEDHGVGVLRALEGVELEGRRMQVLRIEYAGGSDVLAPVSEMSRIWRYGAEAGSIALDRLKGEGWSRRRAEASRQIDADAKALVEAAQRREAARAEPVVPPTASFARFAARFAYPLTPDQRDAITAVMQDLASGRPMDRLICGDVGFGKTEVALRAAAAVLLSGRQVALAAPTTVLARQHLTTFERRFAGLGIGVAQLSRLSSAAETAKTKAALATGEIRLVIGTHALCAKDVAFADLALMILDEEQKFGAEIKASLRARAPHCLSLTATPIPRTLQAALLGVQDVSVIADPPAKRRPIRTLVEPFSAATTHIALMREAKRGGQSFVVAPRISDLDPLKSQLQTLAPSLNIVTAHGEMPSEAVDETMVGFAEGRGDVLLATNIIESGLDVPRANTILVVGAERFGLAQLHQLRGRVGRGRSQGVAYLFTDAEKDPEPQTLARLKTLEAFDRLGAGLELSEQDLDLRGAGDLTGEDQAGHMKLIGAGLYQKLMQRALRSAKAEAVETDWRPEIHAEEEGLLDEAYIPDPALRLTLYARLANLEEPAALAAFVEEIEDRFGPPPPETSTLLAMARLRLAARAAGAMSVRLGPKGAVLTFRPARARSAAALKDADVAWKGDRLVVQAEAKGPPPLTRTLAILEALSAKTRPRAKRTSAKSARLTLGKAG